MPRYVYHCSSCDGHFQVWHGMKETQELCQLCDESGFLLKVPQMPLTKIQESGKEKTGSVTKEYIEKNKELLLDMKNEARGNTYDI